MKSSKIKTIQNLKDQSILQALNENQCLNLKGGNASYVIIEENPIL